MRRALKDLTFSEHAEWFGLGPLAIAVLAGVRAVVADESFARWAWTTVAVVMVLLSALSVLWARRRR